jgi:hypothetical protein
MASKKEVVVAKTQLPEEPADLSLFESDAGQGLDQIGAKDVSLPFILILQSLSPQVKKGDPNRIDGAEEGDFFNTLTREVIDGSEGFTVVPCGFQKAWVEWRPRTTGGGFVKSYNTDAIMNQCSRDEKGFDIHNISKNVIVPTYYYYCLQFTEDGSTIPVVISMSRTAMKAGRKWNSLLSSLQVRGPNGMFNPPIFAQKFKVTTEQASANGNTWYTWKIAFEGLLNDRVVYEKAKGIGQSVFSGSLQVTPPNSESATIDTDETQVF